MLTVDEAKKIGVSAYINKIGYEFCKKHADNATSGYSEEDGFVNCFVGVSDKPASEYDISKVTQLILTSGEKWPYASGNVPDEYELELDFGKHRSPENKELLKALIQNDIIDNINENLKVGNITVFRYSNML